MPSSALKVVFYGITFLTFIGIAIFAFIARKTHDDTVTAYENHRLSKRQQNKTLVNEKSMFEKQEKYKSNLLNRNSSVTRKIVILYWSKAFGLTPPVNFNPKAWPFFYAGNNCPIKCELTTDKRRWNEASALVIHSRNTNELPPYHLKNLSWIMHTNENPIYTKSLTDPKIMGQFNYSASYRLDSDFPCPEFIKPSLEPPVPFKEKTGLIMIAMSNCEPVRTFYTAELMKYITVDSYGGCLRNKHGLKKAGAKTSRHAVTELQRNYKFALVFSNADCDYYMTEKIHSALSAGAVPIWLGTDKIDEVLKWGNLKRSVIKVKDFSSPKKLAEYIKSISENETEYNKYLRWKYDGFQFPAEYYQSPIGQWWDGLPLYCRICMRIARDRKGHHGLPIDRCEGKQKRTVQKWLGLGKTDLKNNKKNQNILKLRLGMN